MAKVEQWNVIINGVEHPCRVEWKKKRSITYSVKRDGFTISVTCPNRTSKETIRKGIEKYIPKLLKRFEFEKPIQENGDIYIFGEQTNIPDWSTLDEKKKIKRLNATLLAYVEERTKQAALEMGVKTPYKVKVRNMTSRYGVNSIASTSITYSTCLVHFSKEIIDSVIYHELTHDRIRNHSSRFYSELYKFSPDYQRLHAKLRKHIYK